MRFLIQSTGVLLSVVLFGFSLQTTIFADLQTITYQEDTSIIANPERGYYTAYNPFCCSTNQPHPPFSLADMQRHRDRYEKITLVNDRIQIGQYMTTDISQEYLDEIDANWDVVRQAGMKVIPRFLYDWSINNRDASKDQIERHMDQLRPLLHKNADVIAWIQAGFYGGSGEANGSDNGYVTQDLAHMLSEDGAELYVRWLRTIPEDRSIVLRYPRLSLDMYSYSFPQYNWTASITSRTFNLNNVLTEEQAFSGSDASRLGFYSDGYMGNQNHWAMFVLPNESEFTARQTNFVVFEGEMSGQTAYNSNTANVVPDMTRYHTTALNRDISDGQSIFENVWRPAGVLEETAKRMGYRFRLVSATFPSNLDDSERLNMSMIMRNDGFSRIMNPRNFEIVLRDTDSGDHFAIKVDRGRGNRMWLPGPDEQKTLTIDEALPEGIPSGTYQVLLHLADPYPSLHDRPEYAIRLTNQELWEDETGFNDLKHTISISSSDSSPSTPQTIDPVCQADINRDGRVDIDDYYILVENFLLGGPNHPIQNPRADINGDGIVDLSDYSLIVKHFFQTCTH